IYAYMIAEGCRYTHDRKRYLLRILVLAALCQIVYFAAMGSLYQCILVTFSMSICLIYALDYAGRHRGLGSVFLTMGALLGVYFVCVLLPKLLPGTDFGVDYGLWGVLLPVLVYCGKDRWQKLWLLTLGVILLGAAFGGIQWWALLTVPLLAAYNGQKGKYPIGKLFYIYYPLHLVVIYGISLLLA
ncbi:MAG: TraX family protein, partial [Faecousia sp.]